MLLPCASQKVGGNSIHMHNNKIAKNTNFLLCIGWH